MEGDVAELRRRPSAGSLEWVRTRFGRNARIASVRWMPLARSHAMHAVRVVDGSGASRDLVLRRYVRAGRLREDPWYSPERETAALRLVEGTEVLAPSLIDADPSGDRCDVPALLTTKLPGRPPSEPKDLDRFLTELAAALLPVHALDGRGVVPAYEPYSRMPPLGPPPGARRPRAWAAAIEILGLGPDPDEQGCFLHRDYHQGNTLWSSGRLVGIVDWNGASFGPSSADLGHMRSNLAPAFGHEAASRFLAAYLSLAGGGHDPYWDLVAIADRVSDSVPGDPADECFVREQEDWLVEVLRKL